MFSNLTLLRLNKFDLTPEQLREKLQSAQFNRCGASVMQSSGFASVIENESLVHTLPGTSGMLLQFASEKKLLPAVVIKQFVAERVKEITEREGHKPGRRATKEITEAVTAELMPQAFCMPSRTLIWIDTQHKWLAINTASQSRVDAVMAALMRCIAADVEIVAISTKSSPVNVMTDWLLSGETPSNFTVDRDCLLKNLNSDASLRFSKHALDNGVVEHIKDGKVPTELALTWDDKVSFSLNEAMQVKKIKLLDTLTENIEKADDALAALDATALLETGTFLQLLPDLVAVLGGFSDHIVQ